MKKCLYISVHEVLEQNELALFSKLPDMDWYSLGAYTYPQGHPSLKRPGIPALKFDQALAEWSRKFPSTNIPLEFLQQFDLVYVMHDPNVINENWDKFKSLGIPIIWRSIGQSTMHVENMLRRMRYDGMKIVRMSPQEANIPGYMGEDTIIRFYADPEDLNNWNGNAKGVINITQSLKGRRVFCHHDSIMQILNGFPVVIYGSGNSDLGGMNGGELTYDLLKGAMRDNRVYVYGGTWPSPVTLAFIEPMMTGMPMVCIGQKLAEEMPEIAQNDRYHYYEPTTIIENTKNGFISDNINELRDSVHQLLEDQELAKQIGEQGRKTAIRLFGKEKVKQAWEEFFKTL